MSATPLLTVIIPAFNAAVFVREAIESVLDNGFADFELLVIDDGSSDDTAAVVTAIRHPALRLVRQQTNQGVGVTRRLATSLARGRLLAMLDADDIAVAGRFARQVEYLLAADAPHILGGAIENFGDRAGIVEFPLRDAEIRAGLLFHDLPLANPAVCLQLDALRGAGVNYGGQRGAEDYALWTDALCAGLRFGNLPAVLTRMRRHGGSLTRLKQSEAAAPARALRARIAARFFPQMTAPQRAALVEALSVNIGGGQRWLDGVCALAQAACCAEEVSEVDAATLRRLLQENFLRMLRHALNHQLIDNDGLEMLTETNADFERWRMAAGGALDLQIIALVTAA